MMILQFLMFSVTPLKSEYEQSDTFHEIADVFVPTNLIFTIFIQWA